ncbi:hypothetical protein E3N88_07048 [Mikania micrantha]|uniref:Uncharacterized protein n=1 Tax=Mikania micrantha TaxID=192012 RepID=A0A5N6PRH5_9ASTR|nr:hypothetical protein E3N88_07048 [Mikania micrantha]
MLLEWCYSRARVRHGVLEPQTFNSSLECLQACSPKPPNGSNVVNGGVTGPVAYRDTGQKASPRTAVIKIIILFPKHAAYRDGGSSDRLYFCVPLILTVVLSTRTSNLVEKRRSYGDLKWWWYGGDVNSNLKKEVWELKFWEGKKWVFGFK